MEPFQDGIWEYICAQDEPLKQSFPLVNNEQPSNFMKAAMIRVLAPEKFIPIARELVALELGTKYLHPPLFDIDRSFEDSSCVTPLIFVLPGADPLHQYRNGGTGC